jgi:DNA-binding transcriptional LysR family regulator
VGTRARAGKWPRFVTADVAALRAAALAGVGVVHLPATLVSAQIDRGDLLHLLPDWEPPRGIIHAVFASRRGLLPSVRALIDLLAERFAAPGKP